MRIALTGTHSTGKTTLVNKLAMMKEFEGYHASYSNTRALKEKGFPINSKEDENYDLTQELVLTFHMKDILRPRILMDRCLVDGLAYTQFLNSKGKVSNLTLELFGQLTSLSVRNYDFIFYCPIRGQIEKDGVREEDESFRLAVDLIIKNHLVPNLPNIYTLPSDNQEENIKFILETINGSKNG